MPGETENLRLGEAQENNSRVTNAVIKKEIEYLTQAFKDSQDETHKWRQSMEARVRVLEDARLVKQSESQAWPWFKDRMLIPAVNYGLALLMGWVFLKATGQLP